MADQQQAAPLEAPQGSAPQDARSRAITEVDAWLRKHGVTPFEGARRLGISYSIMRRVLEGGTPNMDTAAKFVYGSNGAISFEALIPPARRNALRRRYRGLLLLGRAGSSGRRLRPRPRPPAATGTIP